MASSARLPLRLIALASVAVGGVLVAGFLISTINGALEFYARLEALPAWLRWPLATGATLLVAAFGWLLWTLARPAARGARNALPAITREEIDQRIGELRGRAINTTDLQSELDSLDQRRDSGDLYVALFGEISTGKSSLIRALAAGSQPATDVRGGTTRTVALHRGHLPDGRDLVLADVPGSAEAGGEARERIAREEALRAHAVMYLCTGDLTRSQAAELDWLHTFGKPVILVLNKADWYDETEKAELASRLHERFAPVVDAIVGISAGGVERFERVLADGARERVERDRLPDLVALTDALQRVARAGAPALEPARQAAVLADVGHRSDALARAAALREADAVVGKYTRRAIVGALAAIAPGSDILIQGALGTALVGELARVHRVPVREIDIEALLARIGLTVRNTAAIVLAVAGNALKAFPGVGTLGGGLLHAMAYGFVFDSVGHALSTTLAERAELDAADVETRVRALLTSPARDRIERVAALALEAWREPAGKPP